MRYTYVGIDARGFTYQFLGELFRWAHIWARSLIPVKTQLASYSIQDSSAVLVCKLCYVSHSRDTAQGSNRNDNVDAAAAGDNGSGEDEYADMPLLGRRDLTAVAADSAAVACDKSPHDLFIDDSYV